jgi:hypothetical protein
MSIRTARENHYRRFVDSKRDAIVKALSLGHAPLWHQDDEVEGAIECQECGLWGRVVMAPLNTKDKDDVGGRVLSVVCSPDAVYTSEPEMKWDFSLFESNLPQMFAGVGYEPRTPDKFDLIPVRTGKISWERGKE